MQTENNNHLTTAEVAHALGVSTATVKRWCDQKRIQMHKTIGGHRRFTRQAVLQFAHQMGVQVADSETLGHVTLETEPTLEDMYQFLISGQEKCFNESLVHLFLGQTSCASLCDHYITPLLHRVGCDWSTGDANIYQERRALEVMNRSILHLRTMLKDPSPDAALAVGGTFSGNWYHIPNLMAEMVLRDLGWRCVPLGNHLPVESMVQAIKDHKPDLFWLSETHVNDSEQLTNWVNHLFDVCEKNGTKLVIGGQAFSNHVKKNLCFTTCCDTMTHFKLFLTQIFGPQPGGTHIKGDTP